MTSPPQRLAATGDLASEIHALLRETDPARWSAEVAERARERWARIREAVSRFGALHEAATRSKLDEALAQLVRLVSEAKAEPTAESQRDDWMELRKRLMPAYERIAAQLRAQRLPAPTLRPTNWARIGFHVASAVGALLLLEVVLSHRGTLWASGAFAATCWVLETGRALSGRMNDRLMRVRFFQLIIHPHEHHRVNSATWFGTALFVLALGSPPLPAAVALAVLGVGDPLAGLVGRRWGRTPIGGGRTLEGSLAFVLGGALASLGVLLLAHAVASWPLLLAIAAAGAVAGACAEAVSHRVDDNFAVPLAAAAAAWLVAHAAGLHP